MMLQNDQIWAGSSAQATDLPAAQNGGYVRACTMDSSHTK
jgi:hypothetical protein